MRWIVVVAAACASAPDSDSTAPDAPATCADLAVDPAPCEATGLDVSARFIDGAGDPLLGDAPISTPFRVEARFTNSGAAEVTVRSPDCILKEWWLYGAEIGFNTSADCFAPTELAVPGASNAGIASADIDGQNLGAGAVRATVTLWMLDADDELAVCSACAEGLVLKN